jgi:hypothetical protein
MDIEYFTRADFSSRGEAVIKFTECGAVIINHEAMRRLGVDESKKVAVGCDGSNPHDFMIRVGDRGWPVRVGCHGEGIFNSVGLVRHVIDQTWKIKSHVPDEKKPLCMSFRVALLPIDDGENKNVFALLRK